MERRNVDNPFYGCFTSFPIRTGFFNFIRTMEVNILFLIVLFVVAIMYASVGHGGASGYLALMALFGVSTIFMRSSALILNLFVSALNNRWRLWLSPSATSRPD